MFTKKFDLFKKCLGTGATRRNVAREIITIESSLTRRADLGCPAALANLVSAVDEPVVASRYALFMFDVDFDDTTTSSIKAL